MFPGEKLQYSVYVGLSLGAVGFASVLYLRDDLFFQRFFGRLNPLLVIAVISLLGIILLSGLVWRGWFAIFRTWSLGNLIVPFGLVALLATAIIVVDLASAFPEGINVRFPESLLFYPAIAFVAEIVFHVLPLSLLLIVLTSIRGDAGLDGIIWPSLIIVSLLEPIYQTVIGSSEHSPLWVTEYVFLHVFLINLLGLTVFKRYDFVSMYSVRLAYYALWHIGWGYLRLRLLF